MVGLISKRKVYLLFLTLILSLLFISLSSNAQTIKSWGRNNSGQLGDGTNTDSNTPVQASGLNNIIAIAGEGWHSLALDNNGNVWSYGLNMHGQLGDGTNTDSNTPVQVSGLNNIIAIAGVGESHSIALRNDGTVWTWGLGSDGQLGNGTNVDSNIPVQVSGLNNIIAIAEGGTHSLALKNDGTVWAWGSNLFGQLGNGTNTISSNTPVQVKDQSGSGFLTGIIAVAGGGSHSLALDSSGNVWAWGYNTYGGLGNGTNIDSNIPVQVSGLNNIIAIAGGMFHSLALKNDGTVWAWGANWFGQLGDGTNTDSNLPVQVKDPSGIGYLNNIIAIAGGMYHSLALKNDGTVWAWGYNAWGQLGNGTNNDSNIPVQVLNLTGITAIAAGWGHSLAIVGCSTITLSPSSLPPGTAGTSYNQTITATGGTPPYTFSVTSGTLPAGLTLSPGGVLSGTPTANGTFNFTITATDANSCTGSMAYSITIGCSTITLSPSSAALPTGNVGIPYNQTITATGGTPPYTFSYTGNFPPGLTLNPTTGVISGTPTTWGIYIFTVSVVDSMGCSGTKQYVLPIPKPPTITGAKKMTNPFRLIITGDNFHPNCIVKINGVQVPITTYKNSNKVVAKKGSALKSMLPKGVTVQITVENTDDGGVSQPFSYTR